VVRRLVGVVEKQVGRLDGALLRDLTQTQQMIIDAVAKYCLSIITIIIITIILILLHLLYLKQ